MNKSSKPTSQYTVEQHKRIGKAHLEIAKAYQDAGRHDLAADHRQSASWHIKMAMLLAEQPKEEKE